MSESITYFPRPALARPVIKLVEAPLPIPIENILAFLDLNLAIDKTPSVFETAPSVKIKMYRGNYLIYGESNAFSKGLNI